MAGSEKTLRLILGDQLNPAHTWFKRPDDRVNHVIMEVRQETDYVKHHIQKVAAFFAAMRVFADHLRRQGHRVTYLRLDDPANRQTIRDNVLHIIRSKGITRFEYLLPDEHRLDVQLHEFGASLPIPCSADDTEHFLTERYELGEMFSGKKRFLMESFYRKMRRHYDILMDGQKPAGG
ncbi:MAG TPA: cryptochrome/photolyase family protein, partial [Desulfobacterales bacterium]|nr:cryptochrome/photolyase family protein [Desulfobacterales bacterium]